MDGEKGSIIPENTPIDCVLVLGGDGTMLRAAKDIMDRQIPILGINLGTLGFLADVEKDRYKEAIDATEKGLAKTDARSNVDMVVNMYNILGDSYHKLGNNQRAYECYDSCLLYKPNDVLVLNNYAYYLAVEKKKLDKAEEMASKAIEIEKDNPTYIDCALSPM